MNIIVRQVSNAVYSKYKTWSFLIQNKQEQMKQLRIDNDITCILIAFYNE